MKIDRKTRKIKCPKSPGDRCVIFIGFVAAFATLAAIVVFLWFEGVFDRGCDSVEGRLCNGQGICVNNMCVCSNPYFSGDACQETLAQGYSVKKGSVCTDNQGYVGSEFATLEHIAPACRETITTTLGITRKSGGWGSKECLQDTFERIKRVESNNGTVYDLFALPICQCYEGFGGPACADNPCPLNVDFDPCSLKGNHSVGYSDNFTRTGLGCQCTKRIVNYLSKATRTLFSTDKLQSIRSSRALTTKLSAPVCGEQLYSHPDDPGVMVVYTRPEVKTHSCFCQEGYFGEACEYGRCPEINGKICGNNQNTNYGFGAQKNSSVKLTTNAKTVCTAEGSVNCRDQDQGLKLDMCVNQTNLCLLDELVCPLSRPVRCSDGTCVEDPRATIKATNSYGLFENTTTLLEQSLCKSSLFADPAKFLNQAEFQRVLVSCIGDEGFVHPTTGLLVPGGILTLQSSLLVLMVETVEAGHSLRFTYRGKTQTLVEESQNGSVQFLVWTESYEEEQRRLFTPLESERSVLQVSSTEIDIWPSPFVYTGDPTDPVPAEWDKIRMTTTKDSDLVVLLDSSRTRIEFNPSEGEWFLANITASTYVIPGGKIVQLDDCMDDFKRCLWNTETSISYDGNRKLCGTSTSSSNLQCTKASSSRYQRVSVILTATIISQRSDQEADSIIDWNGLSPWKIGPATLAVNDVDFSQDQDEVLIEVLTEGFPGLRSISAIELSQTIVRGACPPSQVNASELDQKWWSEATRRSSDLTPGMKAVGMATFFGMPKLVRGTVTGTNLLTVKGFDEPVRVAKAIQITTTESKQGLPHESFRVFPAMCADGTPTRFTQQILPEIEVGCQCTLGEGRQIDCMCQDEIEPNPYRCLCPSGGDCLCNNNQGGGSQPGFHALEQQVHTFRTDLQSICYFSGFTSTQSQGLVEHLSTVVDSSGMIYIRRPELSDAIFLVEIRVSGGCMNGSVEVNVSATIYSDTIESLETETLCILVNGTQTEVIKPLYDSSFSDSYDQWWLFGLPENATVTPVFVPVGIPVVVDEVRVSSNEAQKENVISNSLTVWTSDDLDSRPTVTLLFNSPQVILGLFVVFDTVGIQAEGTDEQIIVIPVEVTVQTTTDGVVWITSGKMSSDVYQGNQDYWFPFPVSIQQLHYRGVRIQSLLGLGIRQIIPMTNQRCDNTLVRLEADLGFRSIQSDVLQRILNRRIDESIPCVCTETCTINGKSPLSTDSCIDEKYVVERLGKPLYAFVQDRILTLSTAFYILDGIVPDNVTGLYPSFNTSRIKAIDLPLFKVWWLDDSLSPNRTALEELGQADGSGDGFFYVVINPLREEWTKIQNSAEGFPQYSIKVNKTLVERNLACPTGSQCATCGDSQRLDSLAPGLVCQLTAFETQVKEDYLERSNHTVKNSAILDEYLQTGKVRVKVDSVTFRRNVTRLARKGCGDCEGMIKCPTGQCKVSLADCPQPRYDMDGDGCTRESTKNNKYRCVCKVGYGGSDCSIQYCQTPDPLVGKVNPHAWCSCGQDPPICYQPGTMLYAPPKGYYTTSEVLAHNRGGVPRTDSTDVRWIRVHHSFAPFCVRFLRGYIDQGKVVRTNCPFYKIGPRGQKLTLDDCVKTRDPQTQRVTEWNSFSLGNGSSITYVWRTETEFDEARYRCPNSYSCEASPSDCYNLEIIKPPCGRGGKCRADGTCDCFEGKETFVYTKEWTELAKVPYNARNPTEWLSGKKPWMFNHHCEAKNCTDGQCETIPYGCFPGTPERRFRDRQVQCPLSSGNAGFCGVDYQACDKGQVTPTLLCGGNGIAIKVDYRQENKCLCGTLKTRLASLLEGGNVTRGRQSTELKPNGWGGEYCQEYLCQEDPRKMRWVYEDPDTLEPFVDDEGITLPGKFWGGSCGAPIGPSPDDLSLWQQACPGDSRLERCNKVICKIGGVPTAVSPENCRGEERQQMVYRCNGKGDARADGTCECEKNEERGTGWAPDYTGKGCFQKVTCPLTWDGKPCNRLAETYDKWIYFPKDQYLEGQVWSWLLRRGLPATAEQVIKMTVPQPEKLKKLQESANLKDVLEFEADQTTARGSICVYPPPDNSTLPVAMLPYEGFESTIGPYLKSFKFPHDMTSQLDGLEPLLVDRFYQQYNPQQSSPPRVGIEYTDTTESITGVFAEATYVTHVRMYALNPQGEDAKFKLSNEDGNSVCGVEYETTSLSPAGAGGQWQWVHVECQQIWEEYDFTQLGNFYALACLGGTRSSQCTAWKDSVCESITGAQIQTAATIAEYAQCPKSARCCVPKTTGDNTVTMLKIETDIPIYIQEVVVIGYKAQAEPLPEGLWKEIRWLQKNITNFTPHGGGQCLDDLYLTTLLSFDGTPFVHREFIADLYDPKVVRENTTHNFTTGNNACLAQGAHLMISSETASTIDYAKQFGKVCCENNPLAPLKCPHKCLVGARNRDEMPDPLLTDFIRQPCTDNGCFIRMDGTITPPSVLETGDRADFYSCPKDNPLMYQANWANDSLIYPWETTIDRGFQEMMMQNRMYGAKQINSVGSPSQSLYRYYGDNVRDNWLRYGPFVLGRPAKYWSGVRKNAIDASGMYNPSISTLQTIPAVDPSIFGPYRPVRPTFSGVNAQISVDDRPIQAKGATVKYWTDARTCKITVFSRPACGHIGKISDRTLDINGDFSDETKPKGMKTTWFVTPYDDYKTLGKNLIVYPAGPIRQAGADSYTLDSNGEFKTSTWQECADPLTTSADCLPPDRPTFYDTTLRISSISVEGPCSVEYITSPVGSSTLPDFIRTFTEETRLYPTGATGFVLSKNIGEPVEYGCATQCFEQLRCAYGPIRNCAIGTDPNAYEQCPDVEQQYWSAGTIVPKAPFPSTGPSTLSWSQTPGAFDTGYWLYNTISNNPVSLVVKPLFTSYQVEVNYRAEGNKVTDNKQQVCYLFWKTDPYMCMRVEVRVLKSIVNGTLSTDTRVDPNAQMLKVEPVLFRSPSSSNRKITTADIEAMLAQGPGLPYPERFPPCSTLGREVKECPSCVVDQPTGQWEFDPRKYYPDKPQTWGEKVTKMRQSYTGGDLQVGMPKPEINFDYQVFTPSVTNRSFVPLGQMRYPETRFYGALIPAFNLTMYRREFALDNCVVVKATDRPTPEGPVTTEYTLDTAVCHPKIYRALCVRDHTKFMIQRGRQGPECGPSTRLGGVPAPGVTVFDLYPTISGAEYLPLRRKYQAFLEGRLIEYTVEQDIDYDALYLYLTENGTDSIVAGFPEFRKALYDCFSDRPGRLSGGATVPDAVHWVDVCLTNIWPVDCGERCSKETGMCAKRRAIELKWCDPDLPSTDTLVEIPQADYPLGLLPVTASDPYNISSCGTIVDPSTYSKADKFGFPSISTRTFVVLEDLPGESVWLRITREGRSSWQNTGKSNHMFIFRNTTTLYGTFVCSRDPCNITIWLSGLSPSYTTDPDTKTTIGSYTESPFLINLVDYLSPDQYFRHLGWDIEGLAIGDTIRLGVVIATNPQTVLQCKTPKKWKIYQPKPWVEYSTPVNKCLFEYTRDPFTGEKLIPGQCQCDDPSYGGPTCEAPSIVSLLRSEKRTCGGFPSPGFMALDYQGNKVPVLADGSWQSLDKTYWGCKTLNPGLIFRTVLFPLTRFDFPSIHLSHSITGQNQYVAVEALTDDYDTDNDGDTTEQIALTIQGARKTCPSVSASLPSWYTADEVFKFMALAAGKTVFVDMKYVPNQYFKWVDRATEMITCSVSNPCGTVMPVSPCEEDPAGGQCLAIQFNNIAYDQTGLEEAFDGSTSTTSVTLLVGETLVIPLSVTVTGQGVGVKIYQTGSGAFTLDVTSSPTGTCNPSADQTLYDYLCDQTTGISQLTLTAGVGGVVIKEILVYKETDTVRFWHFYS